MTLLIIFANYFACGLLYLVGLMAMARAMPLEFLNFAWWLRNKMGAVDDVKFSTMKTVLFWPLSLLVLGLVGLLYWIEYRDAGEDDE